MPAVTCSKTGFRHRCFVIKAAFVLLSASWRIFVPLMPIAMDLGLDGFGLEEDIPLRGWSMKRGHRKRVEAASCRKAKKTGKASEQYEALQAAYVSIVLIHDYKRLEDVVTCR